MASVDFSHFPIHDTLDNSEPKLSYDDGEIIFQEDVTTVYYFPKENVVVKHLSYESVDPNYSTELNAFNLLKKIKACNLMHIAYPKSLHQIKHPPDIQESFQVMEKYDSDLRAVITTFTEYEMRYLYFVVVYVLNNLSGLQIHHNDLKLQNIFVKKTSDVFGNTRVAKYNLNGCEYEWDLSSIRYIPFIADWDMAEKYDSGVRFERGLASSALNSAYQFYEIPFEYNAMWDFVIFLCDMASFLRQSRPYAFQIATAKDVFVNVPKVTSTASDYILAMCRIESKKTMYPPFRGEGTYVYESVEKATRGMYPENSLEYIKPR
jgi:serine/threonine protein kinase